MADFKQQFKAPQGVSTPSISDIKDVFFQNNIQASSSSSIANIVNGKYRFSIVSGASLTGSVFFKLNSPNSSISATISLAAKPNGGVIDFNQINVMAIQEENDSISNLLDFDLIENSVQNEIALVVTVSTSSLTASNVTVGCIGDLKPDIRNNPDTIWTVPSNFSLIDSRTNINSSLNYRENVDLNSLISPGAVSAQPALLTSAPDPDDRSGTCFTFGSKESGYLSQVFISSKGNMYFRVTDSSRSWLPWNFSLNQKAREEILTKASSDALIWAIVMG